MTDLGFFALMLGFTVALYAVLVSVIGARLGQRHLVVSGENATISLFLFLSLAVGALITLQASNDFNVKYVASYTSRELPLFYKITALWAGQEGSLLFWGWLVAFFSVLVIFQNRRRNRLLMPYVTATMALVAAFFMGLNLFVSNPFERLTFTLPNGSGLNPLLQHPAMVIHPPVLYLGYVGLTVPFAFAIAALVTRQLEVQWIKTTRRWTLFSWFSLGIGMVLGGRWAYDELAWGGYWAWDPVENAALMPWLVATALIHSVMVQEKRGMLKVWNMVLVILSFTLSIFGTFLTRSGVVSSVHSFTASPLGPIFFGFVCVIFFGSMALLISRLPLLKSDHRFDSMLSRESAFLLNNLLFLGLTFAVLWGTLFPVISEAVRGVKITVGAPFFNQVNVPLGLILLFLTGAGPVLAWRKTSREKLQRYFGGSLLLGLLTGVILFALGRLYWPQLLHSYALLSFSLSAFVVATIADEFWRGVQARCRATGEGMLPALYNLTMINRRRYGGYIVHFAMVLMFVGFTGAAFSTDTQDVIRPGQSIHIKDYTMQYHTFGQHDQPAKTVFTSTVSVLKAGRRVATLHPERHFHPVQETTTTEVAIYSSLKEDFYVALLALEPDGKAVFKIYINPLVRWVWIGSGVLVFGSLLLLWPDRRRQTSAAPSHRRQSKTVPRKRKTVTEVVP